MLAGDHHAAGAPAQLLTYVVVGQSGGEEITVETGTDGDHESGPSRRGPNGANHDTSP